ncbi:MAG: bifunctional UDP-N-acetylmuramoyl-tripeptide:D-alanyl-D-alanine ligase/alanine racemase [Roseivirga sp.]|uniref:bifunctional UDP-N-acetylmuramoyl-tripeptide:D-alanyl-D-alanine ligase/alanine racemase n=1 Tax=Roseivirga sp. TaxID=1964215 RepID=UPI001B11C313|nr:bifunctional UDP-N-acetylmuramoyl-tripeptide:D-alanyl-D-alanine ligase/alanine racemase [Roseivirga sp.]MBO6495427.1 bifunctional UDP-N-acetylmuramoyl-tripeptide:D-alanyl-D-alanine ligase/alanine racemase [Roseivirga sp.]
MNIDQLAKVTHAEVSAHQKSETEILTLCYDSRQATHLPNELFVALKGATQDGHDYIPELLRKGSKFFLVEKDIPVASGGTFIKVKSCLLALQQIASYKRNQFEGRVIGITGSNGKTIVKEWLTSVLTTSHTVLASPKSFNSQLGVPLSVWPISNKYDLAIFEAGISKPNEMEPLQEILSPDIGIFTNIGPAHEENFINLEQKVKEKLKLFKRAKTLIYDKDDQLVSTLIDKHFKGDKIGWSRKSNGSIFAQKASNGLTIKWGDKTHYFNTSFEDEASIQNLTHVIVCSLFLGIEDNSIQERIDRIKPVNMRLELKRGIEGNFVIDDTYNNDLAGLNKALNFMEQQRSHEQKTLILSDFIQSKVTLEDFAKLNDLLISKGVDQLIGVGPQLSEASSCFTIKSRFFESTEALINSDILDQLNNQLVLIKGSRKFALERVSLLLTEKVHKTRLEVNLDAVRHNLHFYKSLLKSSTKVMAVIKAMAYGSGSTEIAKLLEYNKIDYLAVAYADEGVALRKDGIDTPIMVMNPSEDDVYAMARNNLEPEVHGVSQLKHYYDAFKSLGRTLPVHLVINTGMNRLGFNEGQIKQLKEVLSLMPDLEVKSIFSHLAASDEAEHEGFSLTQIESFKQIANDITSILANQPLLHILNSGGITRFAEHQLDMVRLGIGLHGVEVNERLQSQLMRPAQLKTIISQIREVKAGESIGYGRKGKAVQDMTIAVMAIGYADGYLRVFGNGNAYVSINQQRAKTIGNVCMDMTMIDITGLSVKEGDEVTVFGNSPTVSELAKWANTIPYEILTNVSGRVQRVFYAE